MAMNLMANGTEDIGGNAFMYGLLALVSAILAAGSFYCFYAYETGMVTLVVGIVFLVATVALGGIFLSAKVNRKEDIHITD